MCTVSIVPVGEGVRLVCNRDERRERPSAWPPALRPIADRAAIFPIDPVSGGTWIGLNDAGIALVTLNRGMAGAAARERPAVSRGTIIPAVIGEGAVRHVIDAALALDATRFDPFRLLIVRGQTVGVVSSDGVRLSAAVQRLVEPVLFTSSALGDRWVEEPRSRLFERVVLRGSRGWLRGQHLFHRHQWRRRRHLSVLMDRDEACTVSRTVIDATGAGSSLRYEPLGMKVASVATTLRGAA